MKGLNSENRKTCRGSLSSGDHQTSVTVTVERRRAAAGTLACRSDGGVPAFVPGERGSERDVGLFEAGSDRFPSFLEAALIPLMTVSVLANVLRHAAMLS